VVNPDYTHRQRVEDCLSGSTQDQVPVALWRHFPVDDQTPDGLARATVLYQNQFGFDLVKVMPTSSFCVKDWGARDEWRGSTEGTRDYTHWVVKDPGDWAQLTVLDPGRGFLGKQIECLHLLKKEFGSHTPFIQTIFNPLSQAKNLAGPEKLVVHLRQYPDAVHEGLRIITQSTFRFIEAIRQTGIAGIFYAIQHAQYGTLSEEEYTQFGCYYDQQILEQCQDFWLNMLHIHGKDIMFDLVSHYPVQVINWHDQETYPSLLEAKNQFPGVVCGGVQREKTLVLGDPLRVKKEALNAIQQTSGKNFILGTGCVVPITAPLSNIFALVQASREISKSTWI